PAVMFSSPAIIRSKVDLPHPEGPTSTTNSPSLIEMSTPWMTLAAPKAFRTSRIATEAINSSRVTYARFLVFFLFFSILFVDVPLLERQHRANHRTFAVRKASPTCVDGRPIAAGTKAPCRRRQDAAGR